MGWDKSNTSFPKTTKVVIGGVCWTMSELILNKIQKPTDAKLLRNFTNGLWAKIFSILNLSNFLPARQKFFTKFLHCCLNS